MPPTTRTPSPEPQEGETPPTEPPTYSFHVEPEQWVWDAFYNQPGYPPQQQLARRAKE